MFQISVETWLSDRGRRSGLVVLTQWTVLVVMIQRAYGLLGPVGSRFKFQGQNRITLSLLK